MAMAGAVVGAFMLRAVDPGEASEANAVTTVALSVTRASVEAGASRAVSAREADTAEAGSVHAVPISGTIAGTSEDGTVRRKVSVETKALPRVFVTVSVA